MGRGARSRPHPTKGHPMTPEQIAALPYRQCVGIVLANADGKVFAAQRIDSPQENPAWQMPQGGIDKGESAEQAAFRELREETGVTPDLVTLDAMTDDWLPYDLPHDLVPKIWKGRYRGQEQKWALMRFAGPDSAIDIAGEHPEFSAWAWKDPAEVLAGIVPFKRDVYAAVFHAFEGKI